MRADSSKYKTPTRLRFNLPMPKPGEIWELSRCVHSPLEFSTEEQQQLYSYLAQRFLEGTSPPRYVMIVKEPEPLVAPQEDWQIVSVMLLSVETNFLSDVDLLIPNEISGVGQDLLALTWHVLPMLTCNLLRPVGRRLSRAIYDVLMSVGDYYHNLLDEAPSTQEIQARGLANAPVRAKQHPEIQAFHQQEEAWSDVLRVPVAAYHTYLKGMSLAEGLLKEALQLERQLELTSPPTSLLPGEGSNTPLLGKEAGGLGSELAPIENCHKPLILLTNWLQNRFEAGWIALADFLDMQASHLALGSRSAEHSDSNRVPADAQEIRELIDGLSIEQDEAQRRRAIKRLGDIAKGNDTAIQALIELMRSTREDETLWTAVETLWQIDPGNPAAGVRRVKLIDLGMLVAGQSVALAVALLQKSDRQVGVLLRVYPAQKEPYLPPDLKLILLDNSGQILREVTARRADIYIQLKFSGQPGEQFSVTVALGEANITEDFAL